MNRETGRGSFCDDARGTRSRKANHALLEKPCGHADDSRENNAYTIGSSTLQNVLRAAQTSLRLKARSRKPRRQVRKSKHRRRRSDTGRCSAQTSWPPPPSVPPDSASLASWGLFRLSPEPGCAFFPCVSRRLEPDLPRAALLAPAVILICPLHRSARFEAYDFAVSLAVSPSEPEFAGENFHLRRRYRFGEF